MTKAQQLNTHGRALSIGTEALEEKTAQRMNSVFRGVNNLIGNRADTRHRCSFSAYSLQ